MRASLQNRTRRFLPNNSIPWLLRAITAVAIVTTAFGVINGFVLSGHRLSNITTTVLQSGTVSISSGEKTDRIQPEVVVIRKTGIEPAEIVRPRGRFALVVYNRSGLSEVQLKLDHVGDTTIRNARVSREKLDWRSVEDLAPGNYVLSEANHPGWACNITITP